MPKVTRMATRTNIVATTLMSGFTPWRTSEKISRGRVVEPGPEVNFALRVPDELPDGYRSVPDALRKANRLTLSVEEAAEVLGISRALAYDAVHRGEIPHIKIGRRLLVPKAALDHLLEVAEDGAASPP